MACRVYREGELLRIDFLEGVVAEDLAAAAARVREIETAAAVVPHRITDLSQVAATMTRFPDIMELAQQRKALKVPNAFKSAIVATQPVHFGIARMFATLNDHPQITIRIFPDLAAARAWIEES